MQERIVGAALGGVRLMLVVAALVVALVPIGRGAVSGFCAPAEVEDAASSPVGAAETMSVLAAPAVGLATIVQPDATPDDAVPDPDPNDDASVGDDTPPTDDGTVDDDATTGPTLDDGPCEGGVERCLPPLISAVVSFGSGPCGGEAVAMLRGSMLPAFGLATVLLAVAWALRPRDGQPVLSRW